MATGLTQAQIDQLRANPNFDQKVLSAYEGTQRKLGNLPTVRGPVAGATKTVPEPTKKGGLASFSAALNEAVTVARAQRQNAELDLVGGLIPKGAVSASQFTGLLANLNQASNQFSAPVVESAISFAESEQKSIEEEKSAIRDLALSVVEAGGKTEIVNGILQATDLDSAIGMAAGALNATGKLKVEKVGSTLVQYDPADPEGTMKVLFGSGSGTGGTSSGGAVDAVSGFDFMDATMSDVKVKAKQSFAPGFANTLINDLTDEQLRLFLNDYFDESNTQQASIDPMAYYNEWRAAAGLEEAEEEATVSNPFSKK